MRSTCVKTLLTVLALVTLQDIQGYPNVKNCRDAQNSNNSELVQHAKSLGYFFASQEESLELEENRIAGGKFASTGEFPFMAIVHRLLENGFVAQCGGSIISNRWILTAGHCIASFPRRFLVVVGSTTKSGISYDSYMGQGIAMITQTGALHPEYNKVINDIGLLRLPLEIPFTSKIQPISLATADYATDLFVGTTVSVIGWGQEGKSSAGTQALKYANIPVISNAKCGNYWNIDERNICTQPGSGEDSCQGDSGGPLVATYHGRPLQIGVVSYGDEFCPSSKPGVYTRVSAFIDWIKAATKISL